MIFSLRCKRYVRIPVTASILNLWREVSRTPCGIFNEMSAGVAALTRRRHFSIYASDRFPTMAARIRNLRKQSCLEPSRRCGGLKGDGRSAEGRREAEENESRESG